MLRAALTLLSTLQIGATIKDTLDRSLKQAVLVIVAALFLIAAAVFGLIAAYHALVSLAQFTPAEAAGIVAGILLLVGLVVLAIVPAIGTRRKPPRPTPLPDPVQGLNLVDEGMGKAMQQVGPIPLLAIAFVAGILAGRK